MRLSNGFGLIFCALFLAGCSSTGRYQLTHDKIPGRVLDPAKIKDAVPHYEPYSRGGNKPYRVNGKSYPVMLGIKHYKQQGTASWYGVKFHGYHTSNGEIYDMYAMTAAHKSLPLPSYVRVTNCNNDRQVVVRVNDRGPFHSGRVIDLSYAAASKLGMVDKGTAPIKLELLYQPSPAEKAALAQTKQQKRLKSPPVPPTTAQSHGIESISKMAASSVQPENSGRMIQVFASSSKVRAIAIADKIRTRQLPVTISEQDALYRVQSGPYLSTEKLRQALVSLQADFTHAYVVN